jgi:putative GTP pyrophosphokinase
MGDRLYSKAQVDAAGRRWTGYLALPADERDRLRTEDPDFMRDLIAANDVIEWWRRAHAYPLTKVNAGLRHYLNPHGRPSVTQRLKKWPTIIYKLQRHPTMRLSAMQDVGGLRTICGSTTGSWRT